MASFCKPRKLHNLDTSCCYLSQTKAKSKNWWWCST